MNGITVPRMINNRLQPVYATLACAVLIAVLTPGCQSTVKNAAAPNISWPNAGEVREHMKEVFRAELAAVQAESQEKPKTAKQWPDAVFYIGVSAAWQATGDEDYSRALEQWGRSVNWQLGPRPRHADDMACGQVYLELYAREGGPERIATICERVHAFLASPQPGHTDWSWCDSFFMAPPVFVKLSAVTGDAHYREAMHPLFQDAIAALWDEPTHLFYRDERFKKTAPLVFWARGNGWVLAGLARVLHGLPANDPARPRYEALFKTLAASIVKLQGEDGAWRADLLNPQKFPQPESSSTALLAYGLAWGVNQRLLSQADYAPAVLKAWAALERMQLPGGQLGSVQPKGDHPVETKPTDTAPFGAGAFLLLGSELLPEPVLVLQP
ncbi:MAG TPA: glycoside hydrolase family 88 protein [Opitutaceae bacterium]|jgi:rhamnogalacturonyl hydrolase YesR|nr:glycoside hydrolase family 88 protein [Opitutaceae bacterium]